MIFPFWLKITYFKRAPVTMMLLVICVFLYIVIPMKNGVNLPSELSHKMSHKNFISVQSSLYENYVKENKPNDWVFWEKRFFARKDSLKGSEWEDFWFQTSFKDGAFLESILKLPPHPDSIRYEYWKKTFQEFKNYQKKDFSGLFGVSTQGFKWSHFITYQFIHSGFLHLFSNMMILVLFGILVELQMGSWVCLLLYLVGGVVGGLFYSATTGSNMAPLIGASGSVSALLSFYLFTEPRRHLRFFFFFFPTEEYFGDIYLSKWWLIPLLILTDINAILTYPDWSLTVAHTAHIGAILFGIIVAAIVQLFSIKVRLNETLSWIPHLEETIPLKDEPKWMI